MSVHTAFVYRRPAWGQGMITLEDARFLHDLIQEARPQVAIELGVASGCSSVTILEAMRQCRDMQMMPAAGEPHRRQPVWLHAFDITPRCYFEPSQLTGAAVSELTPWNVPHYEFAVGDGLTAREHLSGRQVPMAFIDANHLHPWATADLLALLPVLTAGAWVVLHDVRLPFLTGRVDPRGHGPRRLFENWPGEKRQGGTEDNMGAIRLPDDLSDVPALVGQSLQCPWEAALPAPLGATLGIKARPIGLLPKPEAFRVLARAARRRPVYVCGSGRAGRALASELQRRHLSVTGFVDRDPARAGDIVDGLRVEYRDSLSRESQPKPFMVLAGMFATEIDLELASRGWRRGEDYVVIW